MEAVPKGTYAEREDMGYAEILWTGVTALETPDDFNTQYNTFMKIITRKVILNLRGYVTLTWCNLQCHFTATRIVLNSCSDVKVMSSDDIVSQWLCQ